MCDIKFPNLTDLILFRLFESCQFNPVFQSGQKILQIQSNRRNKETRKWVLISVTCWTRANSSLRILSPSISTLNSAPCQLLSANKQARRWFENGVRLGLWVTEQVSSFKRNKSVVGRKGECCLHAKERRDPRFPIFTGWHSMGTTNAFHPKPLGCRL